MRPGLAEALLVFVGIGMGYTLAVTTKANNVPLLGQARHYVAGHQIESFVGLIMIGIIVTLAGGRSGGGGRQR